MSRTSFHVDPCVEGAVVETLEAAGFDVAVGHGPMVDFTVDWTDDETPADPATPDDVPETCEVTGCTAAIGEFTSALVVPPGIDADRDSEDRAVMCDHHHVAARLLAYTQPTPPYVDAGFNEEVAYYGRALGAETFGIPARDRVTPPQEVE